MNKFEYYTWNLPGTAGISERKLREHLNELGAKGWEMCGTTDKGILLFKRPVQNQRKVKYRHESW